MSLLNFLFWNLNKKNSLEEVLNIVSKYKIDILILAENGITESNLLSELKKIDEKFSENHPLSLCQKIKIFTKFDYQHIHPKFEDKRATFRRLELPKLKKINIVALHLPDKSSFNNNSQYDNAIDFVEKIVKFEQENDNETIVIGDFNMNPFEIGMIKAKSFNATMSSNISKQGYREIQGKKYDFFYNPMWSLYGDVKNNVVGSYHYNKAESINYRWNIFDQVLIRPSLIPNFVVESVKILDHDGVKNLLTKNNYPNKKYSDHLPLFFSLNLNTK
jgi:exonuclease III